jgi:hypothetical protein
MPIAPSSVSGLSRSERPKETSVSFRRALCRSRKWLREDRGKEVFRLYVSPGRRTVPQSGDTKDYPLDGGIPGERSYHPEHATGLDHSPLPS